MINQNNIAQQVMKIYKWIDQEIQNHPAKAGICNACGSCCDFAAYDHRLYITSAELITLQANIHPKKIKPMFNGTCPYQKDNTKCAIRDIRFCACRVFCCKGSEDFQSQLSEQYLSKIKDLCLEYKLPYRYMDLKTALNQEFQY